MAELILSHDLKPMINKISTRFAEKPKIFKEENRNENAKI